MSANCLESATAGITAAEAATVREAVGKIAASKMAAVPGVSAVEAAVTALLSLRSREADCMGKAHQHAGEGQIARGPICILTQLEAAIRFPHHQSNDDGSTADDEADHERCGDHGRSP